MNPGTQGTQAKKKTFYQKFLDRVEKTGNKLPDPIMLFVIVSVIILICSAVFSGVTALNPATGKTEAVVNLLNAEGLVKIITNIPNNLTNFPIFVLVLIIMMGVGVCESTGLLKSLMKQTILNAPQKMLIPIVFFIGIMANMAGGVGFFVMPPLVAIMFLAMGKHPIAGLVAAYAANAGGFTANLIINTTEVVLLGFTQPAAEVVDPNWIGNPAFNYYFIVVSTFLLIPVGVWVNNKIVEPRLGVYNGDYIQPEEKITPEEKRGLRWTGIATIVFFVIIGFLTIPKDALFRNAETGSLLIKSPLMSALVPLIFLYFLIIGLTYGFAAKVLKNDKDISSHLIKSMDTMRAFAIFAFVASQMMAWFKWSNLGSVIAINGATFLQNVGFTGLPLIISFVLIAGLINMLVSSNAAKWAILAPIFVPMFMLLGIDPAGTTLAFRIADSITNPITPMMSTFAIVLSFAKVYDKDFGMGSLLSTLLPYSIAFTVMWLIQLAIWYIFKLPIGPGFYIQL